MTKTSFLERCCAGIVGAMLKVSLSARSYISYVLVTNYGRQSFMVSAILERRSG